jgi:hypothetical protein
MSELPPLGLFSVVVRSPDQVSGALDGKVVLLSIENGEYYNLNEVGSRIWELLEQPVAVADLVARLQVEFDVDRGTCEREALAFLEQLRHDNLLRVTAATPR